MSRLLISRNEPSFLFLLIFFLFFSLDVQSPFVFYGTQFLGLTLLTIYRFIIYPRISWTCIKIFFFIVIFLEFLSFFQYAYLGLPSVIIGVQKVVFLLSIVVLNYDYLKNTSVKVISKALSFYIILLSIIVFLQFFGFYFLGLGRDFLDFGLILGGKEARTWYLGDTAFRPTGITSEPAMFIGVQFGLLVLQYLIDKKALFSRLVGLLSICLSLSFLGMILAVLYLIIVYSNNVKNYVIGGVGLFCFYIYSFDLINKRVELFLSGEDGSNNVKIELLDFIFSNHEILLFGYGFIYPVENSPEFFDALGDLTFYINTLTIFGVIFGFLFLLLFFVYIFKSMSTVKEKALIFLALIKLSNPAFLFFSCFIVMMVVLLNNRKIIK